MPTLIIVLGHALNLFSGEPSDILRKRVRAGVALWKKLAGSSNPEEDPPALLVSGGATSLAHVTEAEVMQDLAAKDGVPRKHILIEDKSLTTVGNAKGVWKMGIAAHYDPIYLVTSDFHMARARRIFETQGFHNLHTLIVS